MFLFFVFFSPWDFLRSGGREMDGAMVGWEEVVAPGVSLCACVMQVRPWEVRCWGGCGVGGGRFRCVLSVSCGSGHYVLCKVHCILVAVLCNACSSCFGSERWPAVYRNIVIS